MEHKAISVRSYVLIWLTLIILTFTTWGVAYIDMGPFNIVVALVIAAFKMSLVIYFFMHVKFNDALTRLFVGAGFVWLLIMIALTLADYNSRGWLPLGAFWNSSGR
jgi:cytochrome c oxidase subunit 4